MLTKDEATELYKTIGCFHLVYPCCEGCTASQKTINRVQDKIKELTEKENKKPK